MQSVLVGKQCRLHSNMRPLTQTNKKGNFKIVVLKIAFILFKSFFLCNNPV